MDTGTRANGAILLVSFTEYLFGSRNRRVDLLDSMPACGLALPNSA